MPTSPASRRPTHPRVVLVALPAALSPDEAEFVRTTFATPPTGSHRAKRCSACGGRVSFCHRHDTFFCQECDVWLEAACSEASCRLCRRRPARPSHRRNHRSRR